MEGQAWVRQVSRSHNVTGWAVTVICQTVAVDISAKIGE